VASIVGYFVVRVVDRKAPVVVAFRTDLWKEMLALSFVFSFGMIALNKGYENLHVSLVETLRSMEPVISAGFVSLLMPAEAPRMGQVAKLFIIVTGTCISSLSSLDFTYNGLAWCMASNVCFCLRTIQYKQLSKKHGLNDWNMFFHICRFGIFWQFLFGLVGDFDGLTTGLASVAENPAVVGSWLPLIIANGTFYYAYLQFSWVILMRVQVVTHAVGNAMRRPVVLIANVLYFQNPISFSNGLGISVAFVGVLLYSHGQSSAKVAIKKQEQAAS